MTPAPQLPEPCGLFAWLRQALSRNPTASSKRLLALMAGVTLCTSTAALTAGVLYQVLAHRAVDPQLVIALGGALVATAALAGVAYRKREDP